MDANTIIENLATLPLRDMYRARAKLDELITLVEATQDPAYGRAIEPPATSKQYRQEMINCGKSACKKCRPGQGGHGPYWYAYWIEGTRTRKQYIGNTAKLMAAIALMGDVPEAIKRIAEQQQAMRRVVEPSEAIKRMEEQQQAIHRMDEPSEAIKRIEEQHRAINRVVEPSEAIKRMEAHHQAMRRVSEPSEAIKRMEE